MYDVLDISPSHSRFEFPSTEPEIRRMRVITGVSLGLAGLVAIAATVYGFVLLAQALTETSSEKRLSKFIGAGLFLSLLGIPAVWTCISAIACTKREADNPQIEMV